MNSGAGPVSSAVKSGQLFISQGQSPVQRGSICPQQTWSTPVLAETLLTVPFYYPQKAQFNAVGLRLQVLLCGRRGGQRVRWPAQAILQCGRVVQVTVLSRPSAVPLPAVLPTPHSMLPFVATCLCDFKNQSLSHRPGVPRDSKRGQSQSWLDSSASDSGEFRVIDTHA